MFKSNNIVARIFERQIRTPAPSTSVNCARRFYENLVPSCTIYNAECPDHSFRKFTDDGQFLISFSRNHQDLIVYRPTWPSFSCKEEDCESHDLPSKAKRFESFFTQLYCVSLASSDEFICKDFFLYVESNQFGLFATQTQQIYDASAVEGAIHGVPTIEKITFHLVRLEDGVVLDEKIFCNDFINLAHSMGVFLYADLLAILSLRYQTIYILQIRDSGNLVDVRAIGTFCREDDELFLNSHAQYMVGRNSQQDLHTNQVENGLQHDQQIPGSPFLSGIKQRLLSFIFDGIWNEEKDHSLRVQSLKKKFYFHFQDYVDLIMWKVQFLDRHHLLIKFGSVDGGVARNTDHHPAFFAVYNMETTEFIAFHQNSADELYHLFEKFCDHFHATSRNLLYVNFISSHSNNIYALEQLRSIKNKASSFTQFAKKIMSSLPFSCQSQSPSPYFDQSLFRFDEKLISATDRHRQSTEHPIKFIQRRSRMWWYGWPGKEDLIIPVPPSFPPCSFHPTHAHATICSEYSLPQMTRLLQDLTLFPLFSPVGLAQNEEHCKKLQKVTIEGDDEVEIWTVTDSHKTGESPHTWTVILLLQGLSASVKKAEEIEI